MKKKMSFAVACFFCLFSFGILLTDNSFARAIELSEIDTSNCPNGCYEGHNKCYCHGWSNNEKDAASGGDTAPIDVRY